MSTHEFKTAVFLAYKSILRGSRSTAILLVLIISLSYLNMLFVSGMLFGLQKLMVNSIINLFSSHVTIGAQQVPRMKAYIPNQNEVREGLQQIPGVVATARHYLMAASISYDRLKNGVYRHISSPLIGIDPIEERKVLNVESFLIDGKWLDPTDHDQIILSSALAGGYGVFAPSDLGGARVGDKVRVTFSNGLIRQYTVKGVYNDAIGLFENFITTEEAESVLSVYNEASQILVKGDLRTTPVDVLAKRIETMFPNLRVQPYTALLGSFTAFLNALDLIAGIVSVISVLVAGITMFALVYINAVNKRRQIGILKAIGLNQRIIVISYIIQSLFYAICGVALGYILVFQIITPLLMAHPIDVVFGKLMLEHDQNTSFISAGSLVVSALLAGLIPSWAITRGNILKALSR